MTTWSEAFTAYLEFLGLSQQNAMFALRKAKIKATQSQISYWVRGSRPREPMRDRIARWSKGAVPADLPAVVQPELAKAS